MPEGVWGALLLVVVPSMLTFIVSRFVNGKRDDAKVEADTNAVNVGALDTIVENLLHDLERHRATALEAEQDSERARRSWARIRREMDLMAEQIRLHRLWDAHMIRTYAITEEPPTLPDLSAVTFLTNEPH